MGEHLELGQILKEETIPGKSIIWKIPNNFPFPEDKDLALVSPVFHLANAKWCLRIHVNEKLEQVGVRPIKLVRLESRHPTHKVRLFCGVMDRDELVDACDDFTEDFTIDEDSPEFGNEVALSDAEPLRKEEIIVLHDGFITVKCEILVNEVPHLDTSTQSEEQE